MRAFKKYLGQIDYKIVLVLWLAIGISFSGYYFIHPPYETKVESFLIAPLRGPSDSYKRARPKPSRKVQIEGLFGSSVHYKDYYQDYTLITIVGAILIGGIGFLNSKKKN